MPRGSTGAPTRALDGGSEHGVLLLGLQPSLGLRLGIEEHPLPLAVDLSIDEPNQLAPLFDLLNLHRS